MNFLLLLILLLSSLARASLLKTKKPPVPFAREQEAAKDDGK
jgi:hypothetical protein